MASREQAYLIRRVDLKTHRQRRMFDGPDMHEALHFFVAELTEYGSPVGSLVLRLHEMTPGEDSQPLVEETYAVISDTDGALYLTLEVKEDK